MAVKFRAWDASHVEWNKKYAKPTGEHDPLTEMYNWEDLQEYSLYDVLVADDTEWTDTLMQFSEVLDKNGVEIYQSDIVKTPYGIGKVIKNAGCFMIQWINDPESNMDLLGIEDRFGSIRKDIEVIGNIYQTPELLTA